MPARRIWLIALLVLLLTPATAAAKKRPRRGASPEPVRYTLSIPEPTTRYVHVHVELSDAHAASTELAMPAWAPGSYLIRDFGRHVYDVEAHALSDGAALGVERVDKQTWRVANAKQGFSLDYRVFADELSVRTSYVDDRFALLNGSSVLVYVVDELDRPAELELQPAAGWPVHTALDPLPHAQSDAAPLRYHAADYDELADSPLLLGEAQRAQFRVAGAAVEFVLLAPAGTNAELDRLAADAEQIVRAFARTFNGLPFSRYVFLLVADPVGGGGLEHHDSAAMIVRPWIFSDASGYRRVQRLLAHEFFHLWNVKRIHDRVLGPFDYSEENYSQLLWFHEGFTETIETRALLRAGLVSPRAYVEELANAWTSYVAKPGRNYSAMTELSRDAWIKAYQPAANYPETAISYYEKGNLIGVCLDLSLRLRAAEHGRSGSIEGLFRRLWAGRDPSTNERAITFDDIVAAASAEAGEDMRPFFQRYVHGTEELPLPALLAQAGVLVEATPLGEDDERLALWSGMSGHQSLTQIEPNSPAATAGLMLDDEPIAVAGHRVHSVDEANERLADLDLGTPTTITIFRRDRLLERELTTTPNPHQRWQFTLPPSPNEGGEDDLDQARLRELWLLEHLER
ncbi:M61 family metallopeptidase [Pseudenhygromyxa sp. WMMC2535]|uniref:M61 family metallopeptidase n=1 Tax=Pseudenhygromyxa sp. WMMC2535 TaxID=2712867 RepID=UPI00155413D8|nr:PDZ domain-containing protein [Pseudenhygromyxa sp. WMMC2535]NVB42988.1 M61 family metallopeptidase [Pseudenhygromyxa sp. WMMC2535]